MALRIYCEYNRTGENLRLRFSSIMRAYHFSIQKRHKKIHGTAFFVFTFENLYSHWVQDRRRPQ